jgi:hypothetical protein
MTKKFTWLKLMNLIDGRCFTSIDDIYDILNHYFDENFMTHHLPVAYKYLKMKSPQWFLQLQSELSDAKNRIGDDFQALLDAFTTLEEYQKSYDIPQHPQELKDELINYMLDNSLLIKKMQDNPESVLVVHIDK